MNSFEQILHWLYVALLLLGAACFVGMSLNPKGVPAHKYVIHVFIAGWSALAASALAMDQGYLVLNGQRLLYARYLDWMVTTPLLLLSLNLTGKYFLPMKGWLTGTLLGAQVIVVLTWLVADLSAAEGKQYYWFLVGCLLTSVVLWVVLGLVYKRALMQGDALARVYKRSAVYLTLHLVLYPFIWAIGPPGLGLVSPTATSVLFLLLSASTNAGFGFYTLTLLRKRNAKWIRTASITG
jgi:bacteriorhodopsin